MRAPATRIRSRSYLLSASVRYIRARDCYIIKASPVSNPRRPSMATALFAFPVRPSSFLSFSRTSLAPLEHAHARLQMYANIPARTPPADILLLSVSPLAQYTADIPDSNSIARFSRRKSHPAKWLCPRTATSTSLTRPRARPPSLTPVPR